eukprot:905658-Rhodomonas_salina.5
MPTRREIARGSDPKASASGNASPTLSEVGISKTPPDTPVVVPTAQLVEWLPGSSLGMVGADGLARAT